MRRGPAFIVPGRLPAVLTLRRRLDACPSRPAAAPFESAARRSRRTVSRSRAGQSVKPKPTRRVSPVDVLMYPTASAGMKTVRPSLSERMRGLSVSTASVNAFFRSSRVRSTSISTSLWTLRTAIWTFIETPRVWDETKHNAQSPRLSRRVRRGPNAEGLSRSPGAGRRSPGRLRPARGERGGVGQHASVWNRTLVLDFVWTSDLVRACGRFRRRTGRLGSRGESRARRRVFSGLPPREAARSDSAPSRMLCETGPSGRKEARG